MSAGTDDYGAFRLPDWARPLCAVGGVLLIKAFERYVDDALRRSRVRTSSAQVRQLKFGYGVMFGVAGCAGLEGFTNSVYARMSQDDLRARDKLLQDAAATGRPNSMRTAEGVVIEVRPGPTYVNDEGETCRVEEETARGPGGPPALIATTSCLNAATGRWEQRFA